MNKLIVKQESIISSIPPQTFTIINNLLIYYTDKYVHVYDMILNKIVNKHYYENIQIIKSYNNLIYLCSNDIYIVDSNFKIKEIVKISKVNITNIHFYNNYMMISKLDNLYFYRLNDLKLISKFEFNLPERLFIANVNSNKSDDGIMFGCYNNTNLILFKDNKCVYNSDIDDILFLFNQSESLFLLSKEGKLLKDFKEYKNFDKNLIQAKLIDNQLVMYDEQNNFIVTDNDFNITNTINLQSVLNNDRSNKKIKLNQNISTLLKIVDFNESYLLTSDHDIILHESFLSTRIFMFNNSVTNFISYKEYFILSTNSGCIKFTNNMNSDIFEGDIILVDDEVLTSMKSYQLEDSLIIYIGSKSGKVFKYQINDKGIKQIGLIEFNSSISSLNCNKELLCVSTFNNDLIVIKNNEQIFNEIIHNKEITDICLSDDYIITSSNDKTSKIFDKNNMKYVTVNSNDKILFSITNQIYIAIFSYKYLRIIDYRNLTLIKTIFIKRPILSAVFYDGYILGVSDILKIFNNDRMVDIVNVNISNGWSFDYPFICGDNKIVKLSCEYENSNDLKEKETYLLRNDFKSLMKIEEDCKAQFGIVKNFIKLKEKSKLGNDILLEELVKECKNIGKMLVLNGQLKDLELFNKLLEDNFDGIDLKYKKELESILYKHLNVVDDLYFKLNLN
ncbi:hypothetical protein A0H76_2426 [Hepatospora eriocheir]|uniref:Uncharacterized protein n=1 Tax=Hepatospora eriocheir TaxID=1081669 RepID=A0A1X0QJV0_9MICR|nr:hypothetical protein A0H76_2426 [Hepatospora eriocheir]